MGKVSAMEDEMELIILTDHMSSDNDMEAEVLTTEGPRVEKVLIHRQNLWRSSKVSIT